MTRCVYDAAVTLEIIAQRPGQYTKCLGAKGLDGFKLLVPTNLLLWKTDLLRFGHQGPTQFDKAVQILRELGAEIIEAEIPDELVKLEDDRPLRFSACQTEAVGDMAAHLASYIQ